MAELDCAETVDTLKQALDICVPSDTDNNLMHKSVPRKPFNSILCVSCLQQ
jgi:hypothetical protein